MRNRNQLIAEGTERTGGRREQVLADSGLPGVMKKVAEGLLNQYVVTYGRPETLIPPSRIEVSTSKSRRHGPGAHAGGCPVTRYLRPRSLRLLALVIIAAVAATVAGGRLPAAFSRWYRSRLAHRDGHGRRRTLHHRPRRG